MQLSSLPLILGALMLLSPVMGMQLRASDGRNSYTSDKPQAAGLDQVVGFLLSMIDAQVEAYNDEVDSWAKSEKDMENVIKKSKDAEAQQSASDQKANMKESHDKKLKSIASMIAGIDNALMTLRPVDWKKDHEKEGKDVEAIYEAFPELKPAAPSAASAALLMKKGQVSKQRALSDAMQVLEVAKLESKYLGIKLPANL